MPVMDEVVRVISLDELDRIEVAGVVFRPLRRRLGIRSFGLNAFTAAAAGDELVERHDETGAGSGAQEEVYLVLRGRATFTVGDQEIDAPAGTFVFVPDLGATRHAIAAEPDTSVVVIGAPPDRALPVSPFEYWFAAEPAYRAGEYDVAYQIASQGLEEWPDHGLLHYQLACYRALAGNRKQALHHLRIAIEQEPRAAAWASEDPDFDGIRDDADFPTAG